MLEDAKRLLKSKGLKDTLFIGNDWVKGGLSDLMQEYAKFNNILNGHRRRNTINKITIISQSEVKVYKIGGKVPGGKDVVANIKIAPIYFTGDPFDHYCGYDENGKMLFSISQSCPVEVVYE